MPQKLIFHTRLFPCLLALAALFSHVSASAALLRHQFRQGQTHHYRMTLNLRLEGRWLDRDAKVTLTGEGQIDLKTLEVFSPGKARVSVSFPWISYRLTLPPPVEGEYAYDARSPQSRRTAADQEAGKFWDRFISQPTTMTVDNRGQILDLTLPQVVLEGMGENRRKSADVAGLASEEGLEALLRQLDMVLPIEDPTPGMKWKKNITVETPLGRFGLEYTNQYQGKNGWGMETITATPALSLSHGKNPILMDMKLGAQRGELEWLFNNTLGCLESIHLDHTVNVSLKPLGSEATGRLLLQVDLERFEEGL